MSYDIVKVTPDTDAWLEERRKSIGASEVAAVMGMSVYGTPLDVYKAKQGIDKHFDETLAFVGHASEPIMHEWVERFSGATVRLEQGFMARSTTHPHLHASFDRISRDPFVTWQFKTAGHYTKHHWDEGVPAEYQVQVQAEMFVAGTHRCAVVVWIGGREFRLYWIARDDRFINEHMIPALDKFWAGVEAGEAPEPRTVDELQEQYPSESREVEASEAALEALERYAVLSSDIASMEDERKQLKVAVGNYMKDADTLTINGRKVATFKSQKGRAGFDSRAFQTENPELYADYVKVGQPFKVLRTYLTEEKK